jgi:Flp pilus assembly pilin Flp
MKKLQTGPHGRWRGQCHLCRQRVRSGRPRVRRGPARRIPGCGVATSEKETRPMKAMTKLLGKMVRDEQGGEVLEYALIAGLIIVAAIAVIGSVGTKVLARWNSLNNSM